ncbi:MAG: hypothetical protein AAFR16_04315 [Pseudomonadota bacterium]
MPNDARPAEVRIEKLTRQGIALLQEEKDLALKGDLNALAELNPRKAAFLETMEQLSQRLADASRHGALTGPLAEQKDRITGLLEIVHRRAEENQYLLRAALSGLKSAEKQLSILEKVSSLVGVYDDSGKLIENKNISGKQGSVY